MFYVLIIKWRRGSMEAWKHGSMDITPPPYWGEVGRGAKSFTFSLPNLLYESQLPMSFNTCHDLLLPLSHLEQIQYTIWKPVFRPEM